MKNITYFMNINVRHIFIMLFILFNIHSSFSQVDLRTCGYSCTSNNYTLTDVYLSLSNVNGEPITNSTCTIGQVQPVYIYLNYSSNANSSIYYARLNTDLKINGVTTFLNVLLGEIIPGSNKKLIYGPFNWTCGDELILANTIIAWKTSSNNNPGSNYNCGSYSNSQCDFTNTFTISKPLAVQFTYKACTVGNNTTVNFTSTTNGGVTPYTYSWDFNNDGGVPDSTSPNPTFTYTTPNNTAKLTVKDAQNLTNVYILPIVSPAELTLSETHTNVSCTGGTSNITLTATGGTPGYTYSWNTGATTKDLTGVGPGSYTVTVKDSNNCSKQLTVLISGGDTIKPVVNPLPEASTINCPNPPVFAQATATDNSGTVASLTYVDQTTQGSCPGTYSITRTWTAKDSCNNSSLPVSQTINVVDVTAPAWTTASTALNVTLECSNASGLAAAQAMAPTATDACSANVTYTKSSGAFTASPTCANAGTYTNTWTAKDNCNNTSTVFTQVITIQDTTAPIWSTPIGSLNTTLECSNTAGLAAAQAMFPTASDLCDNDVSNIVKVSGVFVPSQGCGNAGTYTNTWTVIDNCGNTSAAFTQVITIQDTTAPTWSTPVGSLNATLECSNTAGLAAAQAMFPTASDLCDSDVSNIVKVSGVFVPSQGCGNAGTYTNTWTVIDNCGNTSGAFTQVITIQDTTAPTWSTPVGSLNATLECSNTAGLAAAQAMFPTASDLCDSDVSNIAKVSGVFVPSQGCGNAGTYTNTWTVIDNCGNTSGAFTQVITIQDTTAPTWTTAPTALNVTLECSDTAALANAQAMFPEASDLCDANVANIIKVSGSFAASQGCGNAGTYTNTWTVKDDCGNTSAPFTQIITIQDTKAPTWTTAAGTLNVTLECSDTAGLANAQAMFPIASDLCDANVTNIVKVSGSFAASQGCGNAGTYTNTWTVKDDCGNISAAFTQVITIQDTTAPTWSTSATALNVTLECSDTAGLANAQAMFPEASDLCDADVSNIVKETGSFVATQGCGNAGTYTNTWTVKDDCGNTSAAFTQVITIQDTTAPTWTTSPEALNVTLECSDTEGLATAQAQFPIASDLCDADVSNIIKETGSFVSTQGCGNAGTYTNTWTVKDNCGNTSAPFTQTITIQDTKAPTWTTVPTALNVTLECSDTAALANAQAMFPIASDLCDANVTNIIKVSGSFAASQGCGNAGTYTNTWTVKDDCGNNSAPFTQIITIQDTKAPTWTTAAGTLNVTLECSDTAGLANAQAMFPEASDLCDADVSNIVKETGSFVATQECGNAGTYTNTWTVKDDCGNISAAFTQVITIQDTTAPTWNTVAGALNLTLECSDTAGLANAQAMFPEASDLCDADVSNIVKETGSFVATQECGNAGTYTNTWTVKDDCGNTSAAFTQVITIQDTTAPTWNTAAGSLDVTLECSNLEGLATAQAQFPIASDLCDTDVLNIEKVSGQFAATQGCGNAGTYTNTWTVKDDCGNISETFTQVITIQDTTAPTWNTVAGTLNVTLECSDTEGLAAAQAQFPTASDLCDTDVLNIEKVSGQFTATEGCGNAGTYTNTWTVKDDCGNTSAAFTQVITIQDTTAPTWTTAPEALNVTLECSDTEGLTTAQAQFPIASDLCDADVLNIEKVSGQFTATEGCGNAGTYTNTWTVKDDCGNISQTFTQIITIQDTTAPTWTTAPEALNVTLECSDTEGLAAAQAQFPIASDLCDTDVLNIEKVSGQFTATEGCGNAGTYTNTWTVKDDCGNISQSFTQVITIQDTTAPTWTTAPEALNVTLECNDTEGLATAQAQFPAASDLCDADVLNIEKVSGQFTATEGCGNAGTYTNTWTVKDDCGNISETFTQIITIQDTTAPTWNTVAGTLNVTLECSDTEGLAAAQAQFPTASDLCDADVLNIEKVSGQFTATEGCGNAGTYTNTWTVKDDCGNTSETFTQVITIQDTTAPTWNTQAGSLDITLECSNTEGLATAQAQFPTASDFCDADVLNIEKVSGSFVASESCSNAGTYTNTWTVKDDCGNISQTFTQIITIQDTTAPMFTGDLPLDIEVSCDAVPAPAEMHVSDNCNEDLPIVYTEVKSGIENECTSNYTLTRTWKISDCGGNITTHVQIITVRDKTAPTGTAPESITNVATIDAIPVGNPSDITDAADNCSPTVNVTVADTNNGGNGCDGAPYILTRTYTLTDCAGNKTELVQTFTVESVVTVSGVATNTSCFGGTDGSIAVTSTPGSTVVITNENNQVVSTTNLPAGTYTLTATAPVNGENQVCTATATVIITQPTYTVKISGQVINVDTNTPIANVPVTLIPQGTTPGPIQLRITGADGMYSFFGMPAGSYLVQVQDANLNSAYQLYPVDSSLFFTTLEDCKIQTHNFEYGASKLPVLGDYVWYDTNSNGIQDEWYDANNDGVVTKNVPDSNGAVDYSQWEWIDLNGDGSFAGPLNVGELNAGGFGNALSPNVIVDGPNGYHKEVIVGIAGYWRDRPESENPYGQYTVKLVRDANFDTMAANLGFTGLVKVIPSMSGKNITGKTSKTQLHTVCKTTTESGYVVNVTPEDLVHLDIDFGVSCKEYQDIVADDDAAGPIAGVNHTTTNVLNVLTNDTLEGNAITASEVIITTVTPNEFLHLNNDGSVDVLPNAPVGTLTMVYQICEADQTDNCDTATVTVTIEAPLMTVTASSICVNDVPYIDYVVTPVNFTPVNGVTIAWADSNNNVVTTMNNQPLSGRVLWPGAIVDDQGKGIDWPGWIFENNRWIEGADGFEKLRPTTNVTFTVNPSQTITISYPPADPFCTSRPTFAIVANDDNPTPIVAGSSQTTLGNVLTNDMLNGTAVNINDVTLTTSVADPTGSITISPDGTINVAPNTQGGSYTLTYQICEKADFGNCDTAIVTVTIISPIVANDDTYSNIGCNSFGLVGNILSNDVKGRTPITIDLVNFTLLAEGNNTKTDPHISVDGSGNVNVTSLTPAGTYTYSYTICDKLSPENCDSATVTIIVIPNGVVEVRGTACNDDSTLLNLSSLLPEGSPTTGVWQDRNNTNALQGGILNPFGLALGNYVFEYVIADERCPRSVVLNMEINDDCKVLACGNVLVHNAFSPNGDNINDSFKIDNIDETTCYPSNTVEIYNRWGVLVFETTNYNNTTNAFDGTSRGRTTVKQSDGLPTGTYFYIITYKSLDGNNNVQDHKLDGYLYLSK
ncbi:HYR-like domain-containing protein [Flavobacterium anhuiense]|uniref:HYR-like domain-containing protein n=1 Tax=Flavobacterium anhuiense TaxID=459526 RepID=UPI003D998CF8